MDHGSVNRIFAGRKWAAILAAVLLVVILTISAGVTVAYIFISTSPVSNAFTPGNVACEVMETFSNNVKSNVRVKNTGDTEAYIRMAVVITWQDSEGNVAAAKPQRNTDYTVTYTNDNWLEKDGYWYYTLPVGAGDLTTVVLSELTPVSGAAPEGYTLSVQFLASAIQSKPADAVKEAWGVTVDGVAISNPE